jgi:hypothetical protein
LNGNGGGGAYSDAPSARSAELWIDRGAEETEKLDGIFQAGLFATMAHDLVPSHTFEDVDLDLRGEKVYRFVA